MLCKVMPTLYNYYYKSLENSFNLWVSSVLSVQPPHINTLCVQLGNSVTLSETSNHSLLYETGSSITDVMLLFFVLQNYDSVIV